MEFELDSEGLPLLGGSSGSISKDIGQMFLVGFSGNYVTPQMRELITKYHVGSVILSVKNLKNAETTRSLILELQKIAYEAGHEYPLLIAIDQENGMLNNLHDETYLSQFPGPMSMVATKSPSMAKEAAEATGRELKALGINWMLGPVLDVLTNSTNRLLGVRTMGDDPKEVTQFGLALMEGFRAAGMNTCGKHFPGYGNATVDSILGLPVVPESIEQLETGPLIPYRQAVKGHIDAIMVGGCALPKISMNEMHACLSERVVHDLLREDMHFDGVILSECLEMDALYENVGVRQGAVMAAVAGCDIIMVCSSYRLQKEALSGIFGAVQNGIIEEDAVRKAAERVAFMKRQYLNWNEALNPKPLSWLKELKLQHLPLSQKSYEHSITLVRDHAKHIPLTNCVEPDADILLLTPLVTPIISTKHSPELDHLLLGETVFQEFGKSLGKLHTGKILHASYTANGLMSLHDGLIERAKAVIVVTTDANRNMYQVGFTKHVSVICNQHSKPVIVLAASSPYDFALDRAIGTYLCSYEFTFDALDTTAKVLFGLLPAKGKFPGSGFYQRSSKNQLGANGNANSRNKWLVEKWNPDRDLKRLKTLWEACFPDRRLRQGLGAFLMLCPPQTNEDKTPVQTHFVVRNSSTNNLYGFCATWIYESINVGCIAMLFVDPSRRGMSIGRSLHDRAIKHLTQDSRVKHLQIGSAVPSFFPGIPIETHDTAPLQSLQWFKQAGWNIDVAAAQRLVHNQDPSDRGYHTDNNGNGMSVRYAMILTDLQSWMPSKKLISELEMIGIKFDICQPHDTRMDQVLGLVHRFHAREEGLPELYNKAKQSAKIIVALDPVKKAVVGSIILFTRNSEFASYMPWILEFEDARVGGLCGLATDPMYKDLTNIFTLGLVGCGVRQFKLQGFERCVIDGANHRQSAIYADNGFNPWRKYLRITNPKM
ncbi:hypothetical protein TRICI_000763 [Trichomonascus ciferrii]|uniref:Uncharacterized protein n=1 Tax=Trichomonascus ciferrii TaxID=44093 RepID=A0A642VB59_9ASCO|nr:hypothetical protein TRICI_000763 [Trichomonascus ciferrii]